MGYPPTKFDLQGQRSECLQSVDTVQLSFRWRGVAPCDLLVTSSLVARALRDITVLWALESIMGADSSSVRRDRCTRRYADGWAAQRIPPF